MRNVAKKYHKEIADKLKIALTDETKVQNMIALAMPSPNRTPSDRMRRMRSSGWNGAPFTIPRACSRPSCSGVKAEALKLQARLEDLNMWERELVKESKKGSKTYT